MSNNVNSKNLFYFAILFIILLISVWSSSYTIFEGRQVIITQFGKPVATVQDAGLHWKLPFIQVVREVDLRILNWEGYPNQIPTRDKKYISVDSSARWKITDPLKFIQTVQNEQGAKSRLDAILDASIRDIISSHNLVEAVRNSNMIFDAIKKKQELKAGTKTTNIASDKNIIFEEDEVVGEIEKVEIGREKLSRIIIENASKELEKIGILLIDVQLKRIMYEESVEKKVYSRMISERERVAEKIRSIGKGEQAKIEGKTSMELQRIESEAYHTVQRLKGEAEATAISIYAQSLSRDPDFYNFTRKLDAYKNSFGPDSRIILSSQNEYFDIFHKGK